MPNLMLLMFLTIFFPPGAVGIVLFDMFGVEMTSSFFCLEVCFSKKRIRDDQKIVDRQTFYFAGRMDTSASCQIVKGG